MAKNIYKIPIKLYLPVLILLFICSNVLAQRVASHIVHLNSGDLQLLPNATKWMDSMRPVAPREPILTLIHFNTLPTQAEKASLKKQGITLLDYLPDNTFSAHIQFPASNEAIENTPVYNITGVQAEWKATEYVWKKVAAEKGRVEVLVTFYPNVSATAIKQFISAIGGQVHASPMETYGVYKIIIDATLVRSMASWYGVQNISPVTEMVPFDLQSRPAVKGNIGVNPFATGGYGLDGSGVSVGVGDNSAGIYHADLKDRIINFNPVGKGTHGVHVNGIVGGAGNIDPLAQGMAPNVRLLDFFYDLILPSTGAMYNDYNMTVTNNSYGVILGDCSYSGTYDGYAHFLDTLSVQYPDVLHVFASGNDGWMTCSPMPQGFGTVGGGYQPAKNNVVVGSMTDFLGQAFDESRGPTKDGRLKPEIVAVGLGAYSTIKEDEYEWAAGTSMASPQVVGGLALLTQHYKQRNSGAQPKADVMKAILLNGAMDLGNPGPDFSYGFGSMDIVRSLKIIDSSWFSTGSVNNNDSQVVSINVPANTSQLKVLLTWADVPASPSSSRQLVNDLDLSVSSSASGVHLPLVPDGAPANVNVTATEKADHLNNTEQVVINSPAAGVYTIKVKGYNVPYPAQRFVLAYDIVPVGIDLTFPVAGEQITNIDTGNKYDSVRIFWNADDNGHTFKVQFSDNDGATWATLSDTIPSASRYVAWRPFEYNSEKCRIRLSRNGTTESVTSGRFVINRAPIVALDTAQCPGYINIHWKQIPNATGYKMLAKTGAQMAVVATVADTFYSFRNMPLDRKSYVAVRPIINGVDGYRSVAAIAVANSGNCTNPVSNGDLMIEKVTSPHSGRMNTNTQLDTGEILSLKVRNLNATPCVNYAIRYNINGGSWQTYTGGPAIPAHGAATVSIPGIDLSAVGSYTFRVAIENQSITDPVPGNDSIGYTVKQIPNDPILLPFNDGFETMPVLSVVGKDTLGISTDGHWDFHTYDTAGRVRSFVNKDITITGNRSISMDENQNVKDGGYSTFEGTFNLIDYDTATAEVRLDFDYVLHGNPKRADGNKIIFKPESSANWAPFFTYDLNAYPGTLNHARSLSLTDAVLGTGSNFTKSLMLAFGQNDTSLIAATNYGNGLTLDNVKLYTVSRDAQLVQITSPSPTNCGLSGSQAVKVDVRNGVNVTLYNVNIYYRMDGGKTDTGLINILPPKKTVSYTFPTQVTIPIGGQHVLDVWLQATGDTYSPNDSITNYKFRNNPIVTTYPYLENFEAGDGGFYTDGVNNSWQYGKPASPKINKAASGTKAWKTNLTGRYNNLEQSYLYTPCFDISTLKNPKLSFSAAMDIENCGGTLCDRGFIEYTTDNGKTWKKLGDAGQGTNWYDSTFRVWNTNGFTRWHVASISIPAGNVTMSFRFALLSDPGATFEGMAIDDVHVYDMGAPIAPAEGVVHGFQNLIGNTWINFQHSGELLLSLRPINENFAGTTANLYAHESIANPTATQYTFARSFSVKNSNKPDSVGVRLYLLEKEVLDAINDTTCPSCTPVKDAYTIGVTQYQDTVNPSSENGTLADNTTGATYYYPFQKLAWVPYDNGYYAEAMMPPFTEFWFNNGGPTGTFPACVDYLNFIAYKNNNDVVANWRSLIDTAVNVYRLERSADGLHFSAVLDTVAAHTIPGKYLHTQRNEFTASEVAYYRLKWVMTGKTDTFVSPIRKVQADDDADNQVTFRAAMIARGRVLIDWTSFVDGIADHYTLERAINNGSFSTIKTYNAVHHYGQQYSFTDAPADARNGDIISYLLTVTLDNDQKIVLPIKTVEWAEPNTIAAIYPNPSFDGQLNITWYAEPGTHMELNLTDLAGKSIYTTTLQSGHWKNTSTLQTPYKPRGMYLLRGNVGGSKFLQKVVFE